jgi:hypothetical protein
VLCKPTKVSRAGGEGYGRGMDDDQVRPGPLAPEKTIRRLADAYVTLDVGEDTDDFIAWARERGG